MSDSPFQFSSAYKKKKKRRRNQLRSFFFALIRGFLFSSSSCRSAKTRLENSPSSQLVISNDQGAGEEEKKSEEDREANDEMVGEEKKGRDHDVVVRALQRSVKQLHFGDGEEKEAAAMEIKRIAREGCLLRKSLAALGVIPSLVSMLDSHDDRRRGLAIQALVELAHGTYNNKALMVEAGILTRLPNLITMQDQSRRKELLMLLLSISSLAKTQFPIPSSQILPSLIEILNATDAVDEVKQKCLAILYNFSTSLGNTRTIISSGAVSTLLRLSQERMISERALAALGNLVVTMAGKKAIEEDSMVPKSLMEIMTWEDQPRCQELVSYILMVLAHRSTVQRKKMAELGVVPLLLEVALLGSPLAQKRALKILQWFKDERQTRVGVHSGPQTKTTSLSAGSPVNPKETKGYRKVIEIMVKQSLHKNMESIMKRANVIEDASSKLKALVVSTSSKSLPY